MSSSRGQPFGRS